MRIDVVTIVVNEYAPAIEFFVGVLGFELVEDSPALTNDGRPKRWVVVRPPGAETAVLLARADGERQAAAVGNQVAGRVGFWYPAAAATMVKPTSRARGHGDRDRERRGREADGGRAHRGPLHGGWSNLPL
jgi:catechol 2,3-dioxygenase-like lactoylglutathione lyase family enzyme